MAAPTEGHSQLNGAVSFVRSVWNDLSAKAQDQEDNEDDWAPPSPPPCERATCCSSSVEEHETPAEIERCGVSRSRFDELRQNRQGLLCGDQMCMPAGGAAPADGNFAGDPLDLLDGLPSIAGISCLRPDREQTLRFDTPREHKLRPASPAPELHEVTLEYRWDELLRATSGFSQNSVVGLGSSGTVFQGVLEEGLPIAAKVLHNSSGEIFATAFEEEVRLLARCHHPNIAMLLGFAKDTFGSGRRALVYELLPGGSAFSRLHSKEQPFQWRDRLRTALEASRGLSHMHRLKPEVFHRDIKTTNILYDSGGTAKIADWQLACCLDLSGDDAPRGAEGYIAPELETTGATQATEVFAFGVIVLELLSARLPVEQDESGNGVALLRDEVRPDEPSASQRVLAMLDQTLSWPSSTVGGLAELVPKCVHSNPRRRPTFAEMTSVLSGLVSATTPPSSPPIAAEASRADGGAAEADVLASPAQASSSQVTPSLKSPAARRNRFNLAEAYAQAEGKENPASVEAEEAPPLRQESGREPASEPTPQQLRSSPDLSPKDGNDAAADPRLSPTGEVRAADLLEAAAERIAQAEPEAEAAGGNVLQRLASNVSARLDRRGPGELEGSPQSESKRRASGPLDGRWITVQKGKECMVDGERCKWKSGALWTIEHEGSDLYSVTVDGQKYLAQLTNDGDSLEWDDGDTWVRQPPEPDDVEGNERLGAGWKRVRNFAVGAAGRLAQGPGRTAAARDAGEDCDNEGEPLSSDGEYEEEPNAPGRWRKIQGLVGNAATALGGADGALLQVGALAQRIQQIRPLNAVQTVQQKLLQNAARGQDDEADSCDYNSPPPEGEEHPDTPESPAACSRGAPEPADAAAVAAPRAPEPNYEALAASLRLHHISDFTE